MQPPNENGPKSGIKVEIFKLANHLKARMGARFKDQETGFLDPESIAEADKAIAALCETSNETMVKLLTEISQCWNEMRDLPAGAERSARSAQIFTLAHEIKDVGTMCGYELAAFFAESLRDYIGKAELSVKAQVIIVQAHMDALKIVINNDIKTDAGPKAEELKYMVRVAIEKYS